MFYSRSTRFILFYLILVHHKKEKFKIIAKAYEVLRDPVERKLYDFHKITRGSSTMNPTTQAFYQRASNPTYSGKNTRSTNYYRNEQYYTGFNTSSGHDYHEAWERYNTEEENAERLRSRYYQNAGSTATPPPPTLMNTLIGRIAILVALFGMYELWRRQRNRGMGSNHIAHTKAGAPLSLGQMDFETHVGWGREEGMDSIKLQEEMKKKGFRIEYLEKTNNGNTEKKKRRVIMKRERKLRGLDEYVSKKNFKVEKSTAGAMRSF